MTDAEKALIKKVIDDVVAEDVPALIEAEIERLPAFYQALVKGLMSTVAPVVIQSIVAKLHARIDAISSQKAGA